MIVCSQLWSVDNSAVSPLNHKMEALHTPWKGSVQEELNILKKAFKRLCLLKNY